METLAREGGSHAHHDLQGKLRKVPGGKLGKRAPGRENSTWKSLSLQSRLNVVITLATLEKKLSSQTSPWSVRMCVCVCVYKTHQTIL